MSGYPHVSAARRSLSVTLVIAMAFNLEAALPGLIPKAIAWAEAQAALVTQAGRPLEGTLLAVAKSVGVQHPERIRIAEVTHLPLPLDAQLRKAALVSGLLGPSTIGLTLGYGIFICTKHIDVRLLSHEFRHVHQYEAAGSIAAFLPAYLEQIAAVGFRNAPFEVDARTHEVHRT